MEAEAAARRGRSFALGSGTGGAGRARGAARERSAPGAAAAPGSRPRRQAAERSGGRGGFSSSGGGGGAGRSPEEPRVRGARGAVQGALRSPRSEGPPGRAPRSRVGIRLSPAALAPAPRQHHLSRGRAQTTKAEDAALGQGQDLPLKPGGGAHAFSRTEELSLVAGACSRGSNRAPRRSVSCLRWLSGLGASSSSPPVGVGPRLPAGWRRCLLQGPASPGRTAIAPALLSEDGLTECGPGLVPFLERLPSGFSACSPSPPPVTPGGGVYRATPTILLPAIL